MILNDALDNETLTERETSECLVSEFRSIVMTGLREFT